MFRDKLITWRRTNPREREKERERREAGGGSEGDRGGAMDESTETAHIYVNAREPSVLCVCTSSNALCFTNTVTRRRRTLSSTAAAIFVCDDSATSCAGNRVDHRPLIGIRLTLIMWAVPRFDTE